MCIDTMWNSNQMHQLGSCNINQANSTISIKLDLKSRIILRRCSLNFQMCLHFRNWDIVVIITMFCSSNPPCLSTLQYSPIELQIV